MATRIRLDAAATAVTEMTLQYCNPIVALDMERKPTVYFNIAHDRKTVWS